MQPSTPFFTSPLTWLVIVPLVGGLLIASLPRISTAAARVTAILFSLFSLVLAFIAVSQFTWNDPSRMQLAVSAAWFPTFGVNLSYGVDSLSLWLVLLSSFLMPLTLVGTNPDLKDRAKEYYAWLLLLQAAIASTFLATDLILFYVSFEFTLVPLYILIGVFGSGERLKAAATYFIYTFAGSMLTLTGIIFVAWHNARFNASLISGLSNTPPYDSVSSWSFDIQTLVQTASHMHPNQQAFVFLALLAGFAVKIPLFPFHTIPTLAYPSAPTSGSVFLSAILAKMGTYGLIRFAFPMAPQAAGQYASTMGFLAVIGILYAASICWAQRDMKRLVAYSSISHLGFCVLGICALNTIGLTGSMVYMISHGLTIAALFLTIGMLEERVGTREIYLVGGLAKPLPIWSFFMVFFCVANVGLPGLNGFVGEFLTLLGAFTASHFALNGNGTIFAAIAGICLILSAVYTLFLVGKVVFGPVKLPAPFSADGEKPKDLGAAEIGVLSVLALACLALGLFPSAMIRSMEPTSDQLAVQVMKATLPDENRPTFISPVSSPPQTSPASYPPAIPVPSGAVPHVGEGDSSK